MSNYSKVFAQVRPVADVTKALVGGGMVKMKLIQQTMLNGNIVLKDARTGDVVGQMANQEQADRTKQFFKP